MTSQMQTITVPTEAYENFLQVKKQIDEESKEAAQKALKATIRNKKMNVRGEAIEISVEIPRSILQRGGP